MMQKFILDGSTWLFKEDKSNHWQNAVVPGCVHLDLLKAGRIPDPFYRTNEKEVQWINDKNWLYRTRFDIKDSGIFQKDKAELVFDGIDTFADITLNDRKLGKTENMFHEYRFEVKNILKKKNNVLLINFKSPVKTVKALEQKYGKLSSPFDPSCVYARKAQYSFGWDWGPKLPTSGLYKSVRIESYDTARIVSVFAGVTELTAKKANVIISYEIESFSENKLMPINRQLQTSKFLDNEINADLKISLKNKVLINQYKQIKLKPGINAGSFQIEINAPCLWYPNGYGEQPLYDIDFSINKKENIDRIKDRFGLRKVRILQKKDREGKTFIFEVNGIKVFATGCNWIPADSFIPRVSANQYKKLLSLTKGSNMNMLRIWGGGIYESDLFYKLCDELGIMAWQDFMFACGTYPENKYFIDSVKKEFNYQIKRLRNHPSIVLWCGNNENEAYKWDGTKKCSKISGDKIFFEILPKICKKLDPGRLYWPSSPWGYEKEYSSQSTGDRHSWDVWGSQNYTVYSKDTGRFISEFGFQSMPDLKTISSFTEPKDRNPLSEVMEFHNKCPKGMSKLYQYMSYWFPVPEDLKEFIFLTQLLQGQALKYGIEHWRRRKFNTAGALIWQLNDCWPVASWSLVDYSLKPKLSYSYVKKAFSPILVSIEACEDSISAWVVNDKLAKISGKLSIQVKSLPDDKVSFEKTMNVQVNANMSKKIINLKHADMGIACESFRQEYIYVFLKTETGNYSNAQLIKPLKYLGVSTKKTMKAIYKFSAIETE